MQTIVLLVYTYSIPTVEIITSLLSKCFENGRVKVVSRRVSEVSGKDISASDVVLAIRPFETEIFRIIKCAKKNGRKVITYMDDDLLNLPGDYSSMLRAIISKIIYKSNCKQLKKSLYYTDVLWCSNMQLGNSYICYVKKGRMECIDAYYEMDKIVEPHDRERIVKILFAGSGDHVRYLNELVVPALNMLPANYSNMITFTCIGIEQTKLAKCNVGINCIPWIKDIQKYREIVEQQKFDIGVAPLDKGSFYYKKFINKYLEYSRAGLLGIYSNQEPYTRVIRNYDNGLLADATVESWAKMIVYAVDNPANCKEMVKNAQNDIVHNFSIEKTKGEIYRKIPEFFIKSDGVKVHFLPHYFMNRLKEVISGVIDKYENKR